VARPRSFALAAAELHLTASPISHQVARLESHLVCVCLSEAQICGT
jgi:LysR family glycine cleavage system transcriptional activator